MSIVDLEVRWIGSYYDLMAMVLKLEEVADYLKIHPSTVYRLVKDRKIPAFKMGSDWRFNQESIDRWIKDLETDVRS